MSIADIYFRLILHYLKSPKFMLINLYVIGTEMKFHLISLILNTSVDAISESTPGKIDQIY